MDLEQLAEETRGLKIDGPQDWLDLRQAEHRLRHESPMIPDDSVNCVVSNCVLNLVRPEDRRQLFSEVFRVLKLGGRAAISDIVADEDIPEYLQNDPELWSGCISGAFREDQFLEAFEEAGFYGIEIAARQSEPWRTVEGIEFRSLTVVARKGKQGPCLDRNQAVIYRGPFRKVEDDDDHAYYRGQRIAVCDKTFRLLQKEPYTDQFDLVEPLEPVPLQQAERFDCSRPKHRHPRETKGQLYDATTQAGDTCTDSGNCC